MPNLVVFVENRPGVGLWTFMIHLFSKKSVYKIFNLSSILGHLLSQAYLMVHKYCFSMASNTSMSLVLSSSCLFSHEMEWIFQIFPIYVKSTIYFKIPYLYAAIHFIYICLKFIRGISLKRTCCYGFYWWFDMKQNLYTFDWIYSY